MDGLTRVLYNLLHARLFSRLSSPTRCAPWMVQMHFIQIGVRLTFSFFFPLIQLVLLSLLLFLSGHKARRRQTRCPVFLCDSVSLGFSSSMRQILVVTLGALAAFVLIPSRWSNEHYLTSIAEASELGEPQLAVCIRSFALYQTGKVDRLETC